MEKSSGDKEKRQFKKYTYRGVSFNDLCKMPLSKFAELLPSSKRRRFKRGLTEREVGLIKKCELSKAQVSEAEDSLKIVNTHARYMVIIPQMVGCVVGVHNGKAFIPVEIKAEMIGNYLKDFVLTKQIPKHSKPGVGATSGSKFVPLK